MDDGQGRQGVVYNPSELICPPWFAVCIILWRPIPVSLFSILMLVAMLAMGERCTSQATPVSVEGDHTGRER